MKTIIAGSRTINDYNVVAGAIDWKRYGKSAGYCQKSSQLEL